MPLMLSKVMLNKEIMLFWKTKVDVLEIEQSRSFWNRGRKIENADFCGNRNLLILRNDGRVCDKC